MAQDLQLSSSSDESIVEKVSPKKSCTVSLQNDENTREIKTDEIIGLCCAPNVALANPNNSPLFLSGQGSDAVSPVCPDLQEVVRRISSRDRPSGKTNSVKSPYYRKLLNRSLLKKTSILRLKEKLFYRSNIKNTEAMKSSKGNNEMPKLFLINNKNNGESGQNIDEINGSCSNERTGML